MNRIETLLTAAALATLAAAAPAQTPMDHSKMGAMTMAAADGSGMTAAVVRKVDLAQGKVTLKHEEIKSLDMPPMTMVFHVKDKTMLEGVKPGDKVRFKATDNNGKLTVVELTAAP